MDNIGAMSGAPMSDDTFGFFPPDFVGGLNRMDDNRFSSKEEMERYYYYLDHERDQNMG